MSNQLTPREKEIACLVVIGLQSKEIAELLTIKTRTVDVTLGRIYLRLQLRNRTQLAGWVRDHIPLEVR